MDNKRKLELTKLFLELIEGSISDIRLSMLDEYLRQEPEVRAYYCQFMHSQVSINKIYGSVTFADSLSVFRGKDSKNDSLTDFEETSDLRTTDDSDISLKGVDLEDLDIDADESEEGGLTQAMLEFIEMERTAPAVEIEKPAVAEPERELIQKVESNFKLFSGRPSKKLIRVLLAIAASIVVTIGYLHLFVPAAVNRPVVAKLADSINARWDSKLQAPDEFGDMVQSRYRLEEGYASIKFNDGASVTVEAPAELSLNSTGDMELYRGSIYAMVPERAHGFAVMAGGSKIVDLGTEFGVELDDRGNTQLHVTKGKTMLFAGLLSGKKNQINVDEGAAKKVYSDGDVKNIPLAEKKFARRIYSKSNVILTSDIEVIYSEDFSGDSSRINGTAPDITTGGASWIAAPFFKADGSFNSRLMGSMTLEFSPVDDMVYILDASFSNVNSVNWIALGFAKGQSAEPGGYSRFAQRNPVNDNEVVGRAWGLFEGGIGKSLTYGDTDSAKWPSGLGRSGAVDMRIVLDTTAGLGNWKATWYAKAPKETRYTLVRATKILPEQTIDSVGFANNGTDGKIDSFSLRGSQVTVADQARLKKP